MKVAEKLKREIADRILGQVDFDLARIAENRSSRGWTTWALAGALGYCIVMAFEIAKKPQFFSECALQVFCALSILSVGVIVLAHIIEPPYREKIVSSRFQFANSAMEGNRLQVFLIFVQGIILGAILVLYFPDLSWVWKGVGLVLASVEVVLFGLLLVFSYLKLPIPRRTTENRWRVNVFMGIIALIYLALGFVLCRYSGPVVPGCSLIDWEFGGVLLVSSFLLYSLAKTKGKNSMVPALETLRRQLAMGQVEVEDARKRYSIIRVGMKAKDVLRSAVAEFLKDIEVLETECKSICQIIDSVEKSRKKEDLTSTEKTMMEIKDGAISERYKSTDCLLRISELSLERFELMCSALVKSDSKSEEEVSSVREKVSSFGKEKLASIEPMDERMSQFLNGSRD